MKSRKEKKKEKKKAALAWMVNQFEKDRANILSNADSIQRVSGLLVHNLQRMCPPGSPVSVWALVSALIAFGKMQEVPEVAFRHIVDNYMSFIWPSVEVSQASEQEEQEADLPNPPATPEAMH
jgi:hypothetical protein